MLCTVAANGNFFLTWATLTLLAFVSTVLMSAWIFGRFYWKPTFAQWQKKSDPRYPSPLMIRREFLQMMKGLVTATTCPALALHLRSFGLGKAYCGVGDRGVGYLVLSFFIVWIGSDFFEFFYHRIGHISKMGWSEHRHHHVFYNPSPFATIADNSIDQFARSMPMALFPIIMPMNMDLMFFTFAVFFYGYGAYLHWGYELEWPDAHHPWINTSFQHYWHHARSTLRKPLHTGFFFKIWDQLFGSIEKGPCECCKCCVARGERTLTAWNAIEKPDYTPLLSLSFWLHPPAK